MTTKEARAHFAKQIAMGGRLFINNSVSTATGEPQYEVLSSAKKIAVYERYGWSEVAAEPEAKVAAKEATKSAVQATATRRGRKSKEA